MNLRPLIFLLCLGSAAFVQANSKETLSVQGKQQPPASLATPPENLPVEFTHKLKEAESGDIDAMLSIGLVYMDGTDYLSPDADKAFIWFKKSLIAAVPMVTII